MGNEWATDGLTDRQRMGNGWVNGWWQRMEARKK